MATQVRPLAVVEAVLPLGAVLRLRQAGTDDHRRAASRLARRRKEAKLRNRPRS